MKIYTLGFVNDDGRYEEVESSPSKIRIKNSKKRYEDVYKRPFNIRIKNITIKMRNHNES